MTDLTMDCHYFYVLQCRDNSLYAGYTIHLERRLREHNSGTGAKYTRAQSRRPAVMIHTESFLTKTEAMQQEYAFKQLSRRQKEIYLKMHGVHLQKSSNT